LPIVDRSATDRFARRRVLDRGRQRGGDGEWRHPVRAGELHREIGGEITERIYPGMGHAINEDEMKWIERALAGVANARA